MSAKPSPKAITNAFQSLWYRLVLVFMAVYLTVFWFILGPGNSHIAARPPEWLYAVSLLWGTCALVPSVPTAAVIRRVPQQWFRVPAGEHVLHRILGVGIFGWLLKASGWNRRVLEPLRGFTGKRAALTSLEHSVQAAEISHGIAFAIHALLAVLALVSPQPFSPQPFTSQPFTPHAWRGALWILLPGVVFHLYPVLLQRSTMLRLQPLLDKTRSC